MFRGKKTTTFYVGLVALGYGTTYLFYLLFDLFYRLIEIGTIDYIMPYNIPYIFNIVIFWVIGLYVMSKGVEKEPTNNNDNMQ